MTDLHRSLEEDCNDENNQCNCDPSRMGLLVWGSVDQMWGVPMGLRAVLYVVTLLWLFLGVMIVADVFMGAIEVITSKTKVVHVKGKELTVKVWNDTVANLTLMALGSSAPEIMLSVIEIVGNEFFSGELGPSTIVGSAAFNLLCITGVCVCALPGEETRSIKEMGVFKITAFFSVFAYVWLLFILAVNSPNVVDLPEAIISFLFFVILVVLAYLADIKWLSKKQVHPNEGLNTPHIVGVSDSSGHLQFRPHDVAELLKASKVDPNTISEEDALKIAQYQLDHTQNKSRARYRINATRQITGGKEIEKKEPIKLPEIPLAEDGTQVKVCFEAAEYSVKETESTLETRVVRVDTEGGELFVAYASKDETAEAGKDYHAVKGVLHFAKGETEKVIQIGIIDDVEFEDDEHFLIALSEPSDSEPALGEVQWDVNYTRITIVNWDEPGVIGFSKAAVNVTEDCGSASFELHRDKGSTGPVSVQVTSNDGTAIAGTDYKSVSQTVQFAHGETKKTVEVFIINDTAYEKDETFTLVISNPEGGALVGEMHTLTVQIVNDDDTKQMMDRVTSLLNLNVDQYKVGSNSWSEQFKAALSPGGAEDSGPHSTGAWIMHVASVFWKVLFAFVPPTIFAGGWACFFIALVGIAGMTILVGDVATIFGCSITCPNPITAITFVALGTSLPDLFASKAAAIGDQYADASVGNVTGSNSVNVFLGLGLPWCIGAIYWASISDADTIQQWEDKIILQNGQVFMNSIRDQFPTGAVFVVAAGSLTTSVTAFVICACLCIGTLVLRRNPKIAGAELGGKLRYQTGAFFVSLWFVYLTVAITTELTT